jgi:hypothetical protein
MTRGRSQLLQVSGWKIHEPKCASTVETDHILFARTVVSESEGLDHSSFRYCDLPVRLPESCRVPFGI